MNEFVESFADIVSHSRSNFQCSPAGRYVVLYCAHQSTHHSNVKGRGAVELKVVPEARECCLASFMILPR